MGASSVTMWRRSRALISWISAASVLVFPDPVGPLTTTRPFWTAPAAGDRGAGSDSPATA